MSRSITPASPLSADPGVLLSIRSRAPHGRRPGDAPARSGAARPGPRCVATRLLFVVMAVAFTTAVHAEGWGKLTVRFSYGGDPPTAEKLDLNKDVDFCGPFGLVDESLVVDAKTKGIANVVVWLDEAKSGRAPEVHPSYAKALGETVVIANQKCRFEPHVQTMRVGQTLKITNEDDVAHAAAVYFLKNPPVSVTVPAKADEGRKNLVAERVPCAVKCPIHAWMSGYLVIKDHPYVGVSGKDGRVTLENVPAGEWTLRVWHETHGYVDEVRLDGKRTKWKSGYVEVTIPADGTTDLGVAEIDEDEFD